MGKGFSIYEGEFQNGKRHGLGHFTKPNGEFLIGEWAGDHFLRGYGRDMQKGRDYEGQLRGVKDQMTQLWITERSGEGNCEFGNKVVYKGSWHNDRKNGHGIETYPDGTQYVGNF